jgi:hypothetical protein
MSVQSELLRAALDCAARGWRVRPLSGKKPILVGWPEKASTDPDTISRWWTQHPNANVGIATGAASGLVVLDLDGEAGSDTRAKLEQDHGPLPSTIEVLTGAGVHIYFRHPGSAIGNRKGLLPGLDVRGDAGNVVAPGSTHPETGRMYLFEVEQGPNEVQLADLPPWLLQLLTAVEDVPASSTPPRPQPPQLWASTAALLKQGDVGRRYGADHSRMHMAIARAAVLASWSHEELLAALLDPSNVGGHGVRSRDATDARKYVLRTYKTALRWANESLVCERAAALRAAAVHAPWKGVAATTNRKVVDAMLQLAIQADAFEFQASTRQIAELAGASREAVGRAIQRLELEREDDGGPMWFHRPRKGAGATASCARWGGCP